MNKDILIEIASWISVIGTIFPFLLGIFLFKYLQSQYKWLIILFGLGSLTEILSYLYALLVNPANIWITNIYQILETILIIIFYSTLTDKKIKKQSLFLFLILFILYSVYQIWLIGPTKFNDLSYTIESFVVVLLAMLSFHSILKKQNYSNILIAPLFWFNSGFLLYFAGNLYLHLFSQYLIAHAQYAFFELWGLWHSLFSIIFYILISIGLWKTKTSPI